MKGKLNRYFWLIMILMFSLAGCGQKNTDSKTGNKTEQSSRHINESEAGNVSEPDMHDIGILASFDPVAVDQACVDLVYDAEDGKSLIQRIESRNGLHTLKQAEKIGLGSRKYKLGSIDD